MKHIKGNIGLPLILLIEKSVNINYHDDTAFVVHKDMTNHTGGFMTMVTGGAYVKYRKKILSTKSSTLANIFRVNNVLTVCYSRSE